MVTYVGYGDSKNVTIRVTLASTCSYSFLVKTIQIDSDIKWSSRGFGDEYACDNLA